MGNTSGAEKKSGDKTEEEKEQMLAKAKELLGEGKVATATSASAANEADMLEESLSDSDGSADMDGE